MLNLIIDAILPGDDSFNLPPASEINFEGFIKSYGRQGLISEFLNLIEQICADKFASHFLEMSSMDRLKALEACKIANIRVFMEFITNLFRAYYTNARVLNSIHSGSIPPFPVGNMLENDDWEIFRAGL